ncbi:hypothetical protein [Sphingomonas sp.]|uniref:hypothetical protein n=1 Tax=Sphingomonas sp. TaxID=28214 RepID=UPI00286D9350|nr:hypothetical protein [Sphingomonas sp.]
MAQDQAALDAARGRVLDTMESGRRLTNFVTGAAALLEIALLIACILLVDWGDRTQVLLFVIFILSYFIIMLGMLGLAGHVTSATARILAALDPHGDERP